ncbi:MAG: hypothetical protein PHE55_10040 [Methylococcaceae bacterium]|nr:hypothetical protein [Methylococcaceae bacterium]
MSERNHPIEDELLTRIKALISAQTGLRVREQDDEALRRIIGQRMQSLKLSSPKEYCQFLAADTNGKQEQEALTILLTPGETYFFRDAGQFALLKDEILPELIERRQSKRSLRIWSAACSSGEEAYSLAMLLDELMADVSQWDILLLGSDINPQAIARAKRGIYTEWSFRRLDEESRHQYFHRRDETWELDRRIRDRVKFRTGNLLADQFPDFGTGLYEMDLILCRNVFIYLTPAVVSAITDKLTETLAEGGYLITSHGELHAHPLEKLRSRVFPQSIVYQKVSTPPPPSILVPAHAARDTVKPPPEPRPARPAPMPRLPSTEMKDRSAELQNAWRYANQGQRELALKCCSEMIAKNPLDAEPYYLSALLAQENGNIAEAKSLLKKVIYLDPFLIAAYLELGDYYERENNSTMARKMRTTAFDLLKALPQDEPVKLFGTATAREIRQSVEPLTHGQKDE